MARILVLGSYAESLVNFRGALMEKMVTLGHQVFGCAPNASPEIKNVLTKIGVEYQHVALMRVGLNPGSDLRTFMHLSALFRRIRPDVFLGYTIKPVIYGSLAARLTGVPKIFSIITGLGYAFSGAGFKNKIVGHVAAVLYRYGLAYNHKVLFQNPDDFKIFVQRRLIRGHDQGLLINGSGVDVDLFRAAAYPDTLSFLMIARLIRDKGIREYVEAARIIRQRYPDVKFRLVGWIDENPLAISADELHSWMNENIVEYLGQLSDVRPAIADSSVYVLPSYREGTPRTVLEAMAMGRPVITTDAPGCRETVNDGENGFLAPIRDVFTLVKAMERFIKEPKLIKRMGRESRRIAIEKYDVHKVNAVILKAMELTN